MAVAAPQQVLSGKYRLERELGRGGMGAVWLAQHLTLRSPVAIKLIEPEIATNPEALSRFLREAQAAAALRSPHVVQILDHGVDDGVPFIVMELLEGESLAARLANVRCLSPHDTARIMTQVGRAMTKAHEAGIVHRDLKPDNIFLVQNDEEEIAKVLDFGVAKSYTHGIAAVSATTRTGSVLGTPYYMSPEQAEGARGVDHRTDVWAMGVIAFECLVGGRPFDAETLGGLLLAICAREMPTPSRFGAVPAGFDAWFARACSRDVAQRFATAKEAARELSSVCAGDMLTGQGWPPVSSTSPVQATSLRLASTTADLGLSSANQAAKKSRAPWLVLGALSALVVGGGVFFALRSSDRAGAVAAAQSSAALSSDQRTAPIASAPPAPATAAAPAESAASATPANSVNTANSASGASGAGTSSASVNAAAPHPAVKVAAKPHVAAVVEKPKPAPAAAAPAPTAKPRVNLGI